MAWSKNIAKQIATEWSFVMRQIPQWWIQTGVLTVKHADKWGNGNWSEWPCDSLPNGFTALGCSGVDHEGNIHYVCFDFDVGHGMEAYAFKNTAEALAEAKRLDDYVLGAACLSYSSSGRGIHARLRIDPSYCPTQTASEIAKWLAWKLDLKCDRTMLGSQRMTFLDLNRRGNAFRVIKDAQTLWCPPQDLTVPFKPEFDSERYFDAEDYKGKSKADRIKSYRDHILADTYRCSITGSCGSNALLSTCSIRAGYGVSRTDAFPVLLEYNATKADPPWTEQEVYKHLIDGKYSAMNGKPGDRLTNVSLRKHYKRMIEEIKQK